jgi:hypothetical protein
VTERRITYQNRDGVRRTLILDDERPDAVTVHGEQNLDEILAGIARDRELMAQNGPNRHLARIPAVHADRVIGMDDDQLKHFLNDSDNEAFRIWRGRI